MVRITDKDGRQLIRDMEVLYRWNKEFEELLSVSNEREVQLTMLGKGGTKSTRKNEQVPVSAKELADEAAKLKYEEAVWLDGVSLEMINKDVKALTKWFVRLCMFAICMLTKEKNVRQLEEVFHCADL